MVAEAPVRYRASPFVDASASPPRETRRTPWHRVPARAVL
jgi:hypothetical protein